MAARGTRLMPMQIVDPGGRSASLAFGDERVYRVACFGGLAILMANLDAQSGLTPRLAQS
jgi:hypothetical protein